LRNFLDPQVILVTWPVFLFSLSLHEFMHAWTADRLGDPTARYKGRLTLNPLAHYDIIGTTLGMIIGTFGWAKPVPINTAAFRWPKRDMMLSALAGPMSNFALAALCIIGFKIIGAHPAEELPRTLLLFQQMCAYGVFLNLALGIFNLIPLYPLDGHHILRGFLSFKATIAFDRVKQIGAFPLMILILFGGPYIMFVPLTIIALAFTASELDQLFTLYSRIFA